jgi:transposase
LADLRKKLAPFYSDTGRPSIDPELMIRMLIVPSPKEKGQPDIPLMTSDWNA